MSAGALPTETDQCCFADPTSCRRKDLGAVLTDYGENYGIYMEGFCENCYGCPEDPPSAPITVDFGGSLSAEQTASASIEVGIVAGIPGLEASLSATLGATVGTTLTVHGSCSVTCVPCVQRIARATLTVTAGRAAQIEHQWRAYGAWATVPGCALWGQYCSVPPPAKWEQPCGTGLSTGDASLVGSAGCVLTWEEDCQGE